MTLTTAQEAPPLTLDDHGVARIGTTRVALERIVEAFDAGATAEEIADWYPGLELADVYATVAYILRHRSEIDAYMQHSEAESARIRREIEERFPTTELRQRLRARRALP
jgi:uncharacterized protein (DUF433 family)